ncbi:MAG: hypothetical protein ABDH18_04655 [Aquificaceae bacterium]
MQTLGILSLALYMGSMFMIVFFVSPVLLRSEELKNLPGRLYGRVLWRFYPVAALLLLVYLIFGDEKVLALLCIFVLSLSVALSFYLRRFKRSIGDIDALEYNHPLRSRFRKGSFISNFLLFSNFLLAMLSFYLELHAN